jgi:hypothetical protein
MGGPRPAFRPERSNGMKACFVAILCLALAPVAALAFTDLVDEYVDEVTDEFNEWGLPGGETDEPAAPDEPGTPEGDTPPEGPPKKVKKDYAPYGGEGTTLLITSSPTAAPIKIDGRDAGATPTYFTDMSPGRYAVKVGEISDEVELRKGGVTHLDVTLTEVPKEDGDSRTTAGKYVDNRDNYFELHIGND